MRKQAISITFGRGEKLATFVVTLETEIATGPSRLAYNLEAVAALISDAIKEAGSEIVHRTGPSDVS